MRFFLFLILISNSFLSFSAELSELRISNLPQLIDASEVISIEKLTSPWNFYKNDDCFKRDSYVVNEDALRDLGLRRCRDNSVSFIQPKSEGWNGWEGKCGQTAAANTLFHYCRVAKDPDSYVDEYMGDLTPGVRPGTLRRGMNELFKKFQNCGDFSFEKRSFRKRDDFISYIKQKLIQPSINTNTISITRNGEQHLRHPVITLIQNPGSKYLHWVTIVDQIDLNNQCNFIVNHWDDQYNVPCNDLADWSYDVGRSYPIILRSYSLVALKIN